MHLTGAMRKVVGAEAESGVFHPRKDEAKSRPTVRWRLTLECGHVVLRYENEGGARAHKTARCPECPRGSKVDAAKRVA